MDYVRHGVYRFLACGERNSSILLRPSTFDSAAMRPRFLNYSKQESRGETKENPTVQRSAASRRTSIPHESTPQRQC